MKFYLIFLFILLIINPISAKEFYKNGNRVLPIISKNVELQNEKLTIEYVQNGNFIVNVKLTLFNHSNSYDDIVGFKIPFTKTIADIEKQLMRYNIYKKRAFYKSKKSLIKYFKVFVNGKSTYYSTSEFENNKNENILLYYFPVTFKKGINNIEYRYLFHSKSSKDKRYQFQYILEPINRWQKDEIKSFTLFLIMPDYSEINIKSISLSGVDNWLVPYGIAKDNGIRGINMYLKKGLSAISFGDFIPKGKIDIKSISPYGTEINPKKQMFFDYRDNNSSYRELPFHIEDRIFAKDYKSLKILKMLPYARRGVVFKSRYIVDYYMTKTKWYIPNPLVIKSRKILTYRERAYLRWIDRFKKKILRTLPYAIRGYKFKNENLNLYFSNFKWYKQIEDNKLASKISRKDIRWIRWIKHKRYISDRYFFKLLNNYLKSNLTTKNSLDSNRLN